MTGLSDSVRRKNRREILNWKCVILICTAVNLGIFVIRQFQQHSSAECSLCQWKTAEPGNGIHHVMNQEGLVRPVWKEQTNSSSSNGTSILRSSTSSVCLEDYDRVTKNRTKGLTDEDMQRAWIYIGNRYRLAKLAIKLRNRRKPVNAVVSGGSISLGHGVHEHLRYSNRLESWMNEYYPVHSGEDHLVLNRGAHGADICVMAKRVNLIIDELKESNIEPDLFVLEFAVNDYQGQDEVLFLDFKFNVFFEGFERIAICTEAVIRKLLSEYKNAAVVFLDTRSSIMARKTASLLHQGAAQHYQVPVVSYDQALFNDFQYLLHLLKPFNYTRPINDPVLPYPFGCFPCVLEHVVPFFHNDACQNICEMQRWRPGGHPFPCEHPPPGRENCMVPFFAHDHVHPSGVGHQIATDLLIETIASTGRDVCLSHFKPDRSKRLDIIAPLPPGGWMTANPTILNLYTEFISVKDTYQMFANTEILEPLERSEGFVFASDPYNRDGWMATYNTSEFITFELDFPLHPDGSDSIGCYIPYLSVLKSYEKVGTFNATLVDHSTGHSTAIFVDTLWEPRISIPVDIPLSSDDSYPIGCTGKCSINVTTNPEIPGRDGNKVKIVSLAVRKCMDT